MKKEYEMITLKEFKKGKIAINTRTQEESDNLMRFFEKNDMKWCNGSKATKNNIFGQDKEKTCIRYDGERIGGFIAPRLEFCDKDFYKKNGYKIITPNQLKEYNEFMGKTKSRFDKLRLNLDFAIGKICLPSNEKELKSLIKEFSELIIPQETQYLTIGQAIDYMLESEENVVECLENNDIHRISLKKQKPFIECIDKYCDIIVKSEEITLDRISNWINIRKYIEPKKTIKDLIENKEPFKYKNKWYRFNKDGAIIDSKGSALGIDKIKELLTKTNNNGTK